MTGLKVTDVRCQPGDSAFLIDDGTTAVLYDTGFGFTGYSVADNIKAALGERRLDYIFLTHSHYDHALGSPYILRRFPEARVIAGSYAAGVFQREGAKRVMGELDRKFAAKCGVHEYELLTDGLRVDIPVNDGDIIEAGSMRFEVLALPGHTRCSTGFFCRERSLLLSCETLGVYTGDGLITPSFLVGYQMTLDSIDRVRQLAPEHILAPHFGLLDARQSAYFLDNMRCAAEGAAQLLLDGIKQGADDDRLISLFKSRYRNDSVKALYPEDAVNLNTSIMIGLVRRELL